MQRFQKASLLAGTIMAGAMFATPAYAQTETVSSAAEETTESTAIVVTGSRIQRTDLQSTSPVTVVSAEEFRLTGAVNVEQVLNTLPQVLPVQVHRAEFGGHPAHVGARGHHAGAGLEARHDAR